VSKELAAFRVVLRQTAAPGTQGKSISGKKPGN
jgi:hypothetical protein